MIRSFWAAPLLAVAGGLLLVVATGAAWVDEERVRDVGVAVTERVTTPGTSFAPSAVVAGLALLLLGGLLAVKQTVARRAAGGACAGVALVSMVTVAEGLLEAGAQPGSVTAGPWVALCGAVLAGIGGVAAVVGPVAPPRASRHRLAQEQDTDDEWELAAPDDR